MKRIRIIVAVMVTVFCMGCSMNLKDGVTYLEEGKYEEAVTAFKKAIEDEKYGENRVFWRKFWDQFSYGPLITGRASKPFT